MDNKLIDIFLDLVAIEGLSGNEKPVADYVRQFCAPYNLSLEEDDTYRYDGGNSGNLICRVGTGGQRALLAHMDTARSTKNVKPVLKNDRITSDGTSVLGVDNRAGMAIILYTLSRVFETYKEPPDFTIAFTICEETNLLGSRHLDLGPVEMVFIFDSALRPGHFIYQSYGSQRFDVKIIGKAAHSGLAPEKGVNAIKTAAIAINEIETGYIDEETTVNVATIHGGQALNVVPEEVIVQGEIRSLRPARINERVNLIETSFRRAASRNGGKFEFSSAWEFKPYELHESLPIYRSAWSAITKAGLTPVQSVSAGGSDANYLNAKGLQAVNLGIGAQNPHANDEFILFEDLESSARIAWALLTGEGENLT